MNQLLTLAVGLALSFSPGGEKIVEISPLPFSTLPVSRVVEMPLVTRNITETRDVWVTAYSSTPEETDDSPFITASGTYVRDGIMATNLLPFGTEVKIPDAFGDKIFVVEDRMHQRKTNNVDIWMPSKSEALQFGIRYATIEILE